MQTVLNNTFIFNQINHTSRLCFDSVHNQIKKLKIGKNKNSKYFMVQGSNQKTKTGQKKSKYFRVLVKIGTATALTPLLQIALSLNQKTRWICKFTHFLSLLCQIRMVNLFSHILYILTLSQIQLHVADLEDCIFQCDFFNTFQGMNFLNEEI